MSSEPFVRARGLGKRFVLYKSPWGRLRDMLTGDVRGQEHWALRNVDLDLKRGDCVGIVGRNGAGKSTLLELVSGILNPTEGSIETSGRVAALLQLGAGFNPEFTGRENVVLGATLYGLSQTQIEARMGEIESFAGIGEFIDRPVRDYSSGMYARLAFSVCAHVDAEILIVDEILGVGDVRFQQKSMRFMRAFRRRGIILFVSHNEHAVSALCNSAVFIDRGSVVARGPTREVLYLYRRELSRVMGPGEHFDASSSASTETPQDAAVGSPADAAGKAGATGAFDPDEPPEAEGGADIDHATLSFADGSVALSASGGEDLVLACSCAFHRSVEAPRLVFTLRNPMGQIVFAGDSVDSAEPVAGAGDDDRVDWSFSFQLPFLPTGSYPIELFLMARVEGRNVCLDRRETAFVIQVLSRHVSSGMANVAMERVDLAVGAEAA